MEEKLQIEKKSEIQVIADNINSGLKAFEDRKEELTQLKDRVAGLTIESIDDKAAIAEVATARKTLKKARVEIQKEGKSMRDPLTKIGKSILEKEYELIDIISPTEKDLQAKEDWVKAEQEKIDQAEAQNKQALIQARIDKLAAYGFAIDITFLTGINEEQFEKVLDNARAEYEKEEAAKVELARVEQERQAQIEKDLADLKALRARQEEADRIIKERQDELDRQAAEVKKRQEEQDLEAAFQKREAESRLRRDRLDQLNDIGGNGQEYFARYDDTVIVCEYDQLTLLSDEEFAVIRDKHNAENAKVVERKRVEAEALAEKQRIQRQAELDRLQKEAVDKAIAEEKERQRLVEQAKAEEKRLADLKKEQDLAIAGDKTKYQDTLDYLSKTPVHDMRSSQYRAKMKVIRDFLDGLK